MYRSHKLNELRIEDVNKEVLLSGWVDKVRNLGSFIFIDLRDRYGITQILINENTPSEYIELAKKIKNEYVISVKGKVLERSSKNPNLETGDIEVNASSIEILSESKLLPFEIVDGNIGEELRLTYRYLDLRRKKMKENMIKRNQMLFSIREFMNNEGFLDIDTPILGKATPEGARDFIVPSRTQKGSFYALPQSPQLFKQTLMIAGLDRYYQLAKCFRDEDLRADRQLEFTQLDLEMSFVHQEDILDLVERLVKKVHKDITGEIREDKFERISYDYAMDNYGSDKPDLRFDMKIKDLSDIVKNKGFSVFDETINNGGTIRAISCEDREFSRKKIKELEDYLKTYFKAKGLAYIKLDENKQVSSPIAKFFDEETMKNILEKLEMKENTIAFILADKKKNVLDGLGALRLRLGEELGLINKDEFRFVWVLDFPMFEYSEEEQRYVAQHHPFTSIKDEDIKYLESGELEKIKSQSYDLVLNGYEIGGGSIRIHDSKLQSKVFDLLGLSEEEQKDKFGFFLETLSYGVPPHGGLAFGLDRWLMALLKETSIKEVIPFPKNNKGRDLLTGAPADVDKMQLEEELRLQKIEK